MANTHGFTGKEFDEEMGLNYFCQRYYDPEIGRFMTRDLIQTPSHSTYAYCFNNPLKFVDPMGMYPLIDWDTILHYFLRTGDWCPHDATWIGALPEVTAEGVRPGSAKRGLDPFNPFLRKLLHPNPEPGPGRPLGIADDIAGLDPIKMGFRQKSEHEGEEPNYASEEGLRGAVQDAYGTSVTGYITQADVQSLSLDWEPTGIRMDGAWFPHLEFRDAESWEEASEKTVGLFPDVIFWSIVGAKIHGSLGELGWIGAVQFHHPHDGLGHHLEILIRTGEHSTFKIIIPGKDSFIWWGY